MHCEKLHCFEASFSLLASGVDGLHVRSRWSALPLQTKFPGGAAGGEKTEKRKKKNKKKVADSYEGAPHLFFRGIREERERGYSVQRRAPSNVLPIV